MESHPGVPPDADAGAPAHAPAAPPEPAHSFRFGFTGTGAQLFGIMLRNAVFTILTLGFYTPWARAAQLKFMVEGIQIDGDALAFDGRGRELLRGFLIAFGVFVAVFVAIGLLSSPDGRMTPGMFVLYALLPVLVGFATITSMRYRLSRTSWRGIRFSQRARVGDFVRDFAVGSLLVLVTLGWGSLAFLVWRRERLTRDAYFGNRPFDFEPPTGLWSRFFAAVLLTIPTLGLSWVWFDALLKRAFWNATCFGDARFRLDFRMREYFLLVLTNLLLAVVTLGLATPWLIVRTARFIVDKLRLEGPVDLETIRQEFIASPAGGEGLADVFDVDAGF